MTFSIGFRMEQPPKGVERLTAYVFGCTPLHMRLRASLVQHWHSQFKKTKTKHCLMNWTLARKWKKNKTLPENSNTTGKWPVHCTVSVLSTWDLVTFTFGVEGRGLSTNGCYDKVLKAITPAWSAARAVLSTRVGNTLVLYKTESRYPVNNTNKRARRTVFIPYTNYCMQVFVKVMMKYLYLPSLTSQVALQQKSVGWSILQKNKNNGRENYKTDFQGF